MQKKIDGITAPNPDDTLWRYMSFEKFLNMLATESLFFTRAYKYEDPFEGYLPQLMIELNKSNPNIKEVLDGDMLGYLSRFEIELKYVMCNCWHQNEDESMAMWEKYHIRNSGIAIKTTMEKLKNSITNTIDVYIGNIEYISREEFHSSYVLQYLSNESLRYPTTLYLPYFQKRKVFEYEQEVRVIIHIDSGKFDKLKPEEYMDPRSIEAEFPDMDDQGRAYSVDLNTLIDEIIISPYSEHWIEDTVSSVIQQYGFTFEVHPSTLLDDPDY